MLSKKPLEAYVSVFLLFTMTVLMTMEIIARYIFQSSFIWAEELTRYLFIWFIFISSSYAITRKAHIRIESVMYLFPKKIRPYLHLIGTIIWFVFSVFLAYMGFDYSMQMLNAGSMSPSLGISMGIVYLGIPIGFVLMAFRLLMITIKDIRDWAKDGDD